MAEEKKEKKEKKEREEREIKILFCKRCLKKWVQKNNRVPVCCRYCISPFWNRERVYKQREKK